MSEILTVDQITLMAPSAEQITRLNPVNTRMFPPPVVTPLDVPDVEFAEFNSIAVGVEYSDQDITATSGMTFIRGQHFSLDKGLVEMLGTPDTLIKLPERFQVLATYTIPQLRVEFGIGLAMANVNRGAGSWNIQKFDEKNEQISRFKGTIKIHI